MNSELIPIISAHIGGDLIQAVNLRDLHAFLEVGCTFGAWIVRRIDKYGFVEGRDFVKVQDLSSPDPVSANPQGQDLSFSNLKSSKSRAQVRIEYHGTMDMAKELSMVENNDKGRMARRYFIECEKQMMKLALQTNVTTVTDNLPGRPLSTREINSYVGLTRLVADLAGTAEALALYHRLPLPKVQTLAPAASLGRPDLDGEACLRHLLSIKVTRSRLTVADMMKLSRTDLMTRSRMAATGMLVCPPNLGTVVAIACEHPRLKRVFHGTAWADNWRAPLMLLPGAMPSPSLVGFHDKARTAVLIPWDVIAGLMELREAA